MAIPVAIPSPETNSGMAGAYAKYALCLLAIAAAACSGPTHTERMADVDPRGWRAGDAVVLKYENADTIGRRPLNLVLRCDRGFSLSALPLEITVTTPDSVSFTERIEADMHAGVSANKSGFEAIVPYRSNAVLDRSGTYLFAFSPLTPESVKGVTAIGIVRE